jgi:hypothetical protein
MVATLLENYGGPDQQSNAQFFEEFLCLKAFVWKKGLPQGRWWQKPNNLSRWSKRRRDEIAQLQQHFVVNVFRLMAASANWHDDLGLMLAEIREQTLI